MRKIKRYKAIWTQYGGLKCNMRKVCEKLTSQTSLTSYDYGHNVSSTYMLQNKLWTGVKNCITNAQMWVQIINDG